MNGRIALIPGDGIGPEVVEQAVNVLNAVGRRFGHAFQYRSLPAGGVAIQLSPGANALTTADLVKQKANDLAASLPPGLKLSFLLHPAFYYGVVEFPGAGTQFRYTRLLQAINLPNEEPYEEDSLEGIIGICSISENPLAGSVDE